jgi:glyoxylase-like metal-dependent hydrolase (beta-lactamase superfamily II)
MPLKAAILHVTPFQQNCTLLWDEAAKRATVIDPGGDLPAIEAMLARHGLTAEQIVLTHGHIDHGGGADELRERLKVPVVGPHQADKMLLDNLDKQGRAYGLDGARNCAPDRWLAEGDALEMGGVAFDVLHCPGHSPGSVVFASVAEGAAIVGDVLFRGSIGRTDFPYGDHAALIASITEKLLPLGDGIRFLCGHGPGGTFGEERRTNPFLRG